MNNRTVSVSTIHGFDTFEEANAYRKKLKNHELYGVYGIWQSETKQLWVPMPLSVLHVIMEFQEPA